MSDSFPLTTPICVCYRYWYSTMYLLPCIRTWQYRIRVPPSTRVSTWYSPGTVPGMMGVWGEASNKRGLIDCKRDNYWRMSKTHVYLCVFQVSSWWRHLWWCALFLFYCTCIHPLSVVLCMLASIFYNALLWSRRPGASRSAFIIWSLNFWKVAPCSVLVKKSVIMLSVGQYFMVTSFVAKQSVTKKYNAWTERCKTNEILGVFEDWDDVSKVCRSILRGGGGQVVMAF